MTTATIDAKSKKTLIFSSIALLLFTIAVYYPVFVWLVQLWWSNQDYIHGFIVPIFSAYLLWDRRDMLKLDQLKGNYWGIPVIALGLGIAILGDWEYSYVIKGLALVPLLGGMVLLIGGWHAVQWAWSAIVFLVFMFPPPGRFAGLLSQELQAVGTRVSVFVLQTIGIRAVAEGNVIQLSEPPPLNVAEACSGLRMLILFFAACVGAAFYLRNRDYVTRVTLVLSAIPIAIISNVVRITLTAFLQENVGPELANKIFHDLAGWLMMPIAIGLVWLETALLDRLFIVPERQAPIALRPGIGGPAQRGEDRTYPPGSVPPGRSGK